MVNRKSVLQRLVPLAGMVLAAPFAQADASYRETVQITGGALIETLKNIPFMPKSMKQILEPMVSRKALHVDSLYVAPMRCVTDRLERFGA